MQKTRDRMCEIFKYGIILEEGKLLNTREFKKKCSLKVIFFSTLFHRHHFIRLNFKIEL